MGAATGPRSTTTVVTGGPGYGAPVYGAPAAVTTTQRTVTRDAFGNQVVQRTTSTAPTPYYAPPAAAACIPKPTASRPAGWAWTSGRRAARRGFPARAAGRPAVPRWLPECAVCQSGEARPRPARCSPSRVATRLTCLPLSLLTPPSRCCRPMCTLPPRRQFCRGSFPREDDCVERADGCL